MPDINQLKQVISSGDDRHNNRLILDLNGNFQLYHYDNEEDAEKFEKLIYVTRWETFDAGNDYVGIEASNDEKYLSSIMEWANQCWDEYQKTGRTKIVNMWS
ncbi:hypothetical protein ACFPN4_14240 [Ureibacillus thermophilus]|uniref:hypothetical protein n=1 Tax=Ureibacillus thermophilus TaxID=367743 RepID=UPI00361CFE54